MFEIGSSLREARIRHGYDLAEAEAATKIRTKYLTALEEERFEVLPAPTYVKGFLRAYADYLGLDGQLYVDEFAARHGTGDEEYLTAPQRRPPRQSRAQRRVESRVLVLTLAGILMAAALVFLAWKRGDAEPATVANLQQRETPAAVIPQPVETAAQPAVTLVLAAVDGSSWVAVRRGSGSGEVVYTGTIETGRTMRFTGKRLWLNVASPDNLAARLNGKTVSLPAVSRPVVLLVTKKGLSQAST